MNTNLAYKDEHPTELINGKIVMMSPSPVTNHIQTAGNIYHIFRQYLKGKRCRPFPDGEKVYLTAKDHFEPDMMVVCDREKVKPDGVHGAPDLVVEVLSPGTAKRDRGYKKDVYEKCGVKEYWLVSQAEKTIEQYLLQNGKFIMHEIYTLYPDFLVEKMTAEEKAELITEFKCSLYDDLIIKLEDVFEDVN